MTRHCCQNGKPVSHSDQLINHVVDCVATRKPQALYAEYPVSPTSHEEGYVKVTYGKLANAVDRIAWWLVDNLGQDRDYNTLAYIGANDLTYPALILGAVKAGYKTLLLSPRNSIDAQLHLLNLTQCNVFITQDPCPSPVSAVLDSLDDSYRSLKVPSVEELLVPHGRQFVYDVTLAEGRDVPFTVMHTSGSTGLPKPITWPQSFVSSYAKQLQLSAPAGFASTDQLYEANRIFIVFPPFHAAYVAHALVNAVINQTAVIFPLKGAIPSAYSLAETVKATKVDAALVVPSIIEEMSRSPELLESIASRLDTMVYSGGDVPQGCGDIVAARVPLINFYGSTEGASLALVHSDPQHFRKEWKYLSLHPDAGVEFRHHAEDMHEMYIVRHQDSALEAHQQIFRTFPDLTEFRTRDLFRKHPTKPNLWNHCGRADDTIVFITGEKVNPINMEQSIFSRHPEISGVLVAGSQYFQAALLIELTEKKVTSYAEKSELLELFWPSIEEVNQSCPSHARIARTHILFVDPNRPMSRSPKGTIQRAATMVEYAKDLDALYDAADDVSADKSTTATLDLADTDAAVESLRKCLKRITGLLLTPQDNLFILGVDSLQSLLLVREIRLLFGLKIAIGLLYAHPTILSLVEALQLTTGGQPTMQPTTTDASQNVISSVLNHFNGLIEHLPSVPSRRTHQSGEDVYLLTGSTGSLGSHILEALINSKAKHIYCLNRSPDSVSIQRRRNASNGLSTGLPDSRVTFLTADLSHRTLALDHGTYQSLVSSITHIIHTAWSVDFNIPLSVYHPQLQGVVSLVEFASIADASILYISSVSAASSLQNTQVPEMVMDDESAPAPNGYGASKYIAENLLNRASERLALKTQIARVGQIAGPLDVPGKWNKSEWLPSLIMSSLDIRAIPAYLGPFLGRVDWIPIDILAKGLLEICRFSQSEQCTVFNVVNPRPKQWQELLPAIKAALSDLPTPKGKEPIQEIPFEDWIKRVRRAFETREKANGTAMETLVASNPAIKLLGFYEEASLQRAPEWATHNAEEASETLANLGSIQDSWMNKWMKSWFP